jgi:ankyrin repeat protein
MIAAAEGNVAAVEYLVGMLDSSTSSKKVDINAVDVQGNCALSLAAMQAKVKVLSTLIAAGADLNVPNAFALAPLHHAAYSGNLECVRRLIKVTSEIKQQTSTKKKKKNQVSNF